MNVRPCLLARTALAALLALVGYAALVIETPPDALLAHVDATAPA